VATAAPAAAPQAVLTTSRGARPRYRVGESMVLRVQPTQDAYVYCYYRDGEGHVSRIYPNRFQPNSFLAGGTVAEVPPGGGGAFSIRFERAGVPEEVSCLAADREVGLVLPPELMRQDLEPLPVRSLDEIAVRFRGIAGVRVDDARLPIEVTR
jgi:hypothetical protein